MALATAVTANQGYALGVITVISIWNHLVIATEPLSLRSSKRAYLA